MSGELKHCPFCAGKARLCIDEWMILCDECGFFYGGDDMDEVELRKRWNRRAEPSAQGQAVEWTQEPVELSGTYWLSDSSEVVTMWFYAGDTMRPAWQRSKEPIQFPPAAPAPAEPAAEGVE